MLNKNDKARGARRTRRHARTKRHGSRFSEILDKALASAKEQRADAGIMSRTQSEAMNVTNALWLVNDALKNLHRDLNAIPVENHVKANPRPGQDAERVDSKGLPVLALKKWRNLPERARRRICSGCVRMTNGYPLDDAWIASERKLIDRIQKLLVVRNACDQKRYRRISACVTKELNGSSGLMEKFSSLIQKILGKWKNGSNI